MESELHHEENNSTSSSECGSTRLRRRSSVEAPNLALLLDDNATTAEPEQPKAKQKAPRLQRQSSVEEMEKASCKLEPQVEGRIIHITPETLPQLISEREKWDKSVARTIRESVEN